MRMHGLTAAMTRAQIRSAKRSVRRVQRSLTNAIRAFRPDEIEYHLAIGEFGGFQIAYRRGTVDERVIQEALVNDVLFSGVREYEPRADDVIIDVGAHIGAFSLRAGARVPTGRVFAVEASEETFNYLRINIALNQMQNIIPSRLAISDKSGLATLYHAGENWGHSIVRQFSARREEVPSETLEGYLARHGITRCDFIKFNCEGAEFPILLHTGLEALRRFTRMLVLYHRDVARGYEPDMLIAHLQAGGFRTDLRNQREERGWIYAWREE